MIDGMNTILSTSETAPAAGRRRRLDPLGPLMALAATAVFLVQGFDSVLTRDLALFSYAGQQTVEGLPPYVGVLNRAGPLAHLVPAVGVAVGRAVGIDDVLAMRLLMMLISVACVWLLYVLCRDLFRSRLAGLAASSALLTFTGFVTYAVGGPREKTTLTLCVILVFWMVLKQRWMWAGAFVALATLTWQPSFVTGLFAALAAMAGLGPRQMLPAAVRFGVGGLIPTAIITAGFALAGALQEFLDGFVLINQRYTQQSGLLAAPGETIGFLFEGFGASLLLITAGLVAVIVLAALRGKDAFRAREARDLALVGIGAAAVAGITWSLFVLNGWADIVVLLPAAAVGVGAVAAEVQARVPERVGVPILVIWTVVCLLAGAVSSFENRENVLDRQRAEVAAMFAAVPSDATVMSVGGPEPLVLTHRRNPIRHQMFLTGLEEYVDDTWPGGLEGLAEWVGEEKPTFITVDHPEWYSWLRPTLDEQYVDVGTSPGDFHWYVHRSVGQDTIDELRTIPSGAVL